MLLKSWKSNNLSLEKKINSQEFIYSLFVSQILYLIKESFSGWKEHRMVLFPTLVTIFLCSALLSASLLALRGGTRLLKMEGSFYTIDAFLKDSISNAEISEIQKNFKTEKWLDSLEFISQEEATKIFKNHFSAEMLEMVGENPLPASFKLHMNERYWVPSYLEEWLGILERSGNFDAVQAPLTWARTLAEWKTRLFFWPILGIILLLFTLSLIIGNAVRLSLYSRKVLVENMKYTGASRFFIEFPFVLEGMGLGFVGSLLASLLTITLFSSLGNHFPLLGSALEGKLLPVIVTVISVSFLSAFASLRAVRKFLAKERGVSS